MRVGSSALAGVLAAVIISAIPAAAGAQPSSTRTYDIPAGSLAQALNRFAQASGSVLSADAMLTRDKTTAGVTGAHTNEGALTILLRGTGLSAAPDGSGGFVIRVAAQAPSPISAPARPPATENEGPLLL